MQRQPGKEWRLVSLRHYLAPQDADFRCGAGQNTSMRSMRRVRRNFDVSLMDSFRKKNNAPTLISTTAFLSVISRQLAIGRTSVLPYHCVNRQPLEANAQFLRHHSYVWICKQSVMVTWHHVDLQTLGGHVAPGQSAVIESSFRRSTTQEEGDPAGIDVRYIITGSLTVRLEDLPHGTRQRPFATWVNLAG